MTTLLKIISFPFILIMALLAGCAIFLAWASGVHIDVTNKNQKVGYIRWFKYTKI